MTVDLSKLSLRAKDVPRPTVQEPVVGVVDVARSNDGNADGCSNDVGVHELRLLQNEKNKVWAVNMTIH